jgi:membrane-associated phospholipid phosphatase
MTAKRYLYLILIFLVFVPRNSLAQGPMQPQPEPRFDDRVLLDLQNHRTTEQTDIFLFLSRTHLYGDIGIPVGMFIAGAMDHNQALRQNSLFVASSTAVSFGVTYLLKVLVKRPRPFIQNINLVPVYRAGDYSFPSGHTSSTFATASALSMAYPKWYVIGPSLLWAGATSYSRMYLGEHYPTDVAAGATIGVGSALSMSFLKK